MTLVIGYGNPGRGDDGLGPAFAQRVADWHLSSVDVLIDYQLKVEHALLVANARRVVFADAQIKGATPFDFAPLVPSETGDVTSHSLHPDTLLALTNTLYGAAPVAFVLGITGAEFGRVHEGLSATAERNLARAETFFLDWLETTSATPNADRPPYPALG